MYIEFHFVYEIIKHYTKLSFRFGKRIHNTVAIPENNRNKELFLYCNAIKI